MATQSLAQTTSYSGFSLHSQGETAVAARRPDLRISIDKGDRGTPTMVGHVSRTRVITHASEQGEWRVVFRTPTSQMAPSIRQFIAYTEYDIRFTRRVDHKRSHDPNWSSRDLPSFKSNVSKPSVNQP